MLIYKVRYGVSTSGVIDNVVEIDVEEKPKSYVTNKNERYDKSKLGIIDTKMLITPSWVSFYCFVTEDQIEDAKERLKNRVKEEIEKMNNDLTQLKELMK